MKKLEDVINGTKFQKKKRVLVDSYTKVGFNELHSFQFSILFISNLVFIKNISCIMSQIIHSLITLGHEGPSVHCTMLLIPLHHLCLLKNPLFSQLLSLGNSGNGIAISGRISDIPKVNLWNKTLKISLKIMDSQFAMFTLSLLACK